MEWNRLYLKNRIKSSNLQTRGVEGGLLTDDLIDEAINHAMMIVTDDCNLNPKKKKLALEEAEYEYELPDDILAIRSVWYVDGNNRWRRLTYLSAEQLMDTIDPSDTASEPDYYSYPLYAGKTHQFYGTSDYVKSSTITTASSTILIDSVANFGKLLAGDVIRPGDKITNITDDSYGYVYVLDLSTNLTTGTATGDTSNRRLYDTGKDFADLGVQEYYVICTPSTGDVAAYAIVEAVDTTYLTYRDFRDPEGSLTGFVSEGTYKVGIANRIVLDPGSPHPYLREGAENTFAVDDQYKVQSKFATQPVMWLNPAPDADDTTGSESIRILYNRMPQLPEKDSDPLETPLRYEPPLLACARWQAYLLKGNIPENELDLLEGRYQRTVRPFLRDINRPPRDTTINPWRNRRAGNRGRYRYMTPSGLPYDAGSYDTL